MKSQSWCLFSARGRRLLVFVIFLFTIYILIRRRKKSFQRKCKAVNNMFYLFLNCTDSLETVPYAFSFSSLSPCQNTELNSDLHHVWLKKYWGTPLTTVPFPPCWTKQFEFSLREREKQSCCLPCTKYLIRLSPWLI